LETLKEIQRQAAARHGGPRALEEMLPRAKTRAALRRIPDDRWLSSMTRAVFQAGFVWRIVEHKWPGFEEAFDGFDPKRVDPQKVRATRDNARLLVELAAEHGSAARCFADWPEQDIVGLWDLLKRRGSRLGGNTGPYFLRSMGKDTPILTPDVVRALRDQEVIEQKSLTSKRAQRAVQDAFNAWREESGRSLCEISRILACSVGS
jgi:3-methyladenine DNA glycosylase Tag